MDVEINWGSATLDVAAPAVLGLDVEGRRDNVRLIQLGYGDRAWLFDTSDPEHLGQIKAVLSQPYRFCAHSHYDSDAIWGDQKLGIDLTGRVIDTFLLACLVYPGEHNPHGLKPLSSKLIDGDLQDASDALDATFKSTYGGKKDDYMERGFNEYDVRSEVYSRYAGMDAVYCRKLLDILLARVPRKVARQEHRIADILNAASNRGIRVDRQRTESLLAEAEADLERANSVTVDVAGCPAGSIKLSEWLLERGVDGERTDSGALRMDKGSMPGLLARYSDADEEVVRVLEARLLRSQSSNRVSNLRNFLKFSEATGKVHADIKTAIALTGRMSVTEPALQTLKKADPDDTENNNSLRGCFIADPGYVFVDADFSNVELRVAAALSGEKVLAQRLIDGADLHSVVADSMFGPGAHKDKRKRAVAKNLNFSILYGAGANSVTKTMGCSPDEAREMIQKWWAQYPHLKKWDSNLRAQTSNGQLTEAVMDSGRIVPLDAKRPHAVANVFVQGNARDILCKAILIVEDLMPGIIALPVHDELVCHVPEDQAEDALEALRIAMNFTYRGMPIVSVPEIVGRRWGG